MHHLVGLTEIAAMLGLSRQRVHRIASTDPTFPKPQAELSAGLIWRRSHVEAWARKSGRPIADMSP